MKIDLQFLLREYNWVVQAFVVILLSGVADYIQRRVLRRLHTRLVRTTKTLWDEAVVDAVRPPLTLIIWLFGVSFAAEIARNATGAALLRAVEPLRELGVIAVITWFLARLVYKGEDAYKRTDRPGKVLDRATVDAIGKLLRISLFITAFLVALETLGFSISGVLAFGGIGGVAVGFAAKDLLANIFGGVVISLDRPFAVGDWIRSPDKEIEGVVEHISWRLTRIRTFDKRPLYVPNALFTTIVVENPSRMTHRRIKEFMGVRHQDATRLAAILEEVKTMLAEHPEIDQSQVMIVNLNSLAPSALEFFIYVLTRTTDWVHYHEVKEDVLLKVVAIVTSHGAQLATPTTAVELEHAPPMPLEAPPAAPEAGE